MSAIIFDLDGTIANSFDFVVGYLARKSGIEVDDELKKSLRGQSLFGVAKKLGYRWWDAPGILINGRIEMKRSMRHIFPFKDMPETIKKIKNEGHELFIVSSNSVSNISLFLKQNKLNKYFLEIYGGEDIFGKSEMLNKLLNEQNLDPKDSIYIGDEVRDVVAAEKSGIRSIAVTWGFSNIHLLRQAHPSFIVNSPHELLSVLEEM